MREKPIVDRYATKATRDNEYDARAVAEIHRSADTDSGKTAIHHTIGPAPDQVASGKHTHDGGETVQLGAGITITGSRGGNVALANLLTALEAILGIEDNTT